MELRFLLDEDTERRLAALLRQSGHEVCRVVAAGELGPGASDGAVRFYAKRHDRILLTHDADHCGVPVDRHAGVFYVPDQRLPSWKIARIVDRVVEYYPHRSSLPPLVFLTEGWIDADDG